VFVGFRVDGSCQNGWFWLDTGLESG